MDSSLPRSALPQKLSPSLENLTIMKLRQELQLLTAELKDREKEHRDMVAARQAQMLAWEHDWQKILTLEERCRLLSNELNERDEIIKSLAKRLKFLESQQNDSKTTFENRQQEFKELPLKVTDATAHCQALEELRKKSVLREARAEEFSLNKEKQDLKLRLKELILETNKLKDDLYEKMKENNKQQEEIIHLKEENGSLRNELALTVEKAERRDQLLQFAKSKQAQTDTELSSLRQLYVKQQLELQFLRVSLESSEELRQKLEKAAHERSTGMAFSAPESNSKTDAVRTEDTHGIYKERGTAQVPKRRVKNTSETCEVDNRLLLNASDVEGTTSVYFNQCQKVVKVSAVLPEEEEKQDVASSSDELGGEVFCEANNTRPLRNRGISESGMESRDQQAFESSLPERERWLNVRSCVDSQSALSQDIITSFKTDNENKTWEERTGILFEHKSREPPAAVHTAESDSCSNNFTVKKDARWEPISDAEWLKIFKPVKRDGSIWHGKDGSCLKTAPEMKYASLKSEEDVDLSSFHLDSSCLMTSTQKGDRPPRCEKFSDEDFPLESHLSVTKPTNRRCNATMDQGTSSPISKLQHALAESRQRVADLELNIFLHASPRCSPNSSNTSTTIELAEALHRTQFPTAEEGDAKLRSFSL